MGKRKRNRAGWLASKRNRWRQSKRYRLMKCFEGLRKVWKQNEINMQQFALAIRSSAAYIDAFSRTVEEMEATARIVEEWDDTETD